MSTNKQAKGKQNLLKQIEQLSEIDPKRQIPWLLRSLLVKDRASFETGFVLPTVAMVSLVVVLLSVALVVRAFDRSRNASNVRVNQVVLNAATPALDRAKAKIDALFVDPTLPRATPSDIALDIAIKSSPNRYKFGDETSLKLVTEFNGTAGIQKRLSTNTLKLEDDETIRTAWKYPVDTDNNGLFDSYTLYGIYFRSPTRDANGKFDRQRNPLEARTPPMSGGYLGSECKNASSTTANLVGDSSWYKTGTKLTKSFYVYTATVPITTSPGNGYEVYKGNKGFTALEYQQDRSQIPINNNAVVFQDDLELTPGTAFRLNGRVFTNANLLIGGHDGGAIRLFQVSSKNSCFYKEEDGKITVGGNVGTGNINDTTNQASVAVDLYDGFGKDPVTGKVIDGSNKSTTSTGGAAVGYNDTAYNNRIALMKQSALSPYTPANPPTISVDAVTKYPKEVKEGFKAQVNANPSLDRYTVLADQIEIYLKDRTRRVPYAEIATPDTDAKGGFTDTTVFAAGTIEPPAVWREPTDANTKLTLSTSQLEQTDPDEQKKLGKEVLLGDRINVGNNLPLYWKNDLGKYVTGIFERQFFKPPITPSAVFWTGSTDKTRFRTTQVAKLPDLGIAQRTGFWEDAAAQTPEKATSNTGGLRVVTGAGIYVDTEDTSTQQNRYFATLTSGDFSKASFLRKPQLDTGVMYPEEFTISGSLVANIVVWPDTMPMTGGAAEIAGANQKGDLQMRATAIYHYKDTAYNPITEGYINRTPTACISSYYDPTNSITARNPVGLPDVSAVFPDSPPQPALGVGRSNNGVVYPAPYTTDAARVAAVGTYRGQLNRQARLIFPNGRIVNEPLRNALKKINDATLTRSLSDNSAIDTAICAIKILDGTIASPSNSTIEHGAIKESSFLDARQVKALDRTPTAGGINPISPNELSASTTLGNYNLQLEQRQPLEIRVTDIDMGTLRGKTIGGTPNQEYLLPNSGIIYATREDALLDESAGSETVSPQTKLLSPTDFKLDPTRRPNGIRLINGSNLARDNNYRQEEKGLILVTNLPVYIRGDFNLHQKPGGTTLREEFTNTLDNTWSNFYSRTAATLNANFACRINQLGCGTEGDQWRPATIISDATSLISVTFADGFRDWGDYDLNNNAGFSTIAKRLKNGFFENSFATSSWWWDKNNTENTPYPSGKLVADTNYVSSYLTNGVTPVQRRTDFPEYVMEICRKIPVSECQPADWVVGYDTDNNGTITVAERDIKIRNLPTPAAASQLVAGTTALGALLPEDRRYARRVAFKRKNSNSLELTTWVAPNENSYTPIPMGINTGGQVAEFAYNSATNVPRIADNALWFRTTSNTNGKPFCSGNNIPTSSGCTADNRVHNNNKPLYYDGSTKLISPPTPEIPGVTSLNSPVGNPASGYTVCTNDNSAGVATTKVLVDGLSDLEPTKCNETAGNPMTTIQAARENLLDLTPSTVGDNIVVPTRGGSLATFGSGTAGETTTFITNNADASNPSAPVVNIIDITGDFPTKASCTRINLVGDENSIFVLRRKGDSELSFGGSTTDCGVQVELDGVEPNNVFWAIDGNVKWNQVAPDPAKHHKMVGTFLTDSTGVPFWNTVDFDEGGRILGPNVTPVADSFRNSKIYAISSNAQPLIAPVLQIHSPGGTPADTLDTDGSILSSWIQQAGTATTFNAAFVTGNSPSRPAEESAGLHNFVRFMERWNNTTVNIKGSFIQLEKSAYATAPFSPIRSTGNAPISSSNNGSLSIFGYLSTLYPSGGGTSNTLTFYDAPTRQWGFDVALLTQSPDLFAQRYSLQSTNAPSEFFRQVGQDDDWVKTLLCAAQGSGTSYTDALGRSSSGENARPSTCPALTDYAD